MYHAGTPLKLDILLARVLVFFQEDTLHICVELTEPLFLFFGRRDPSSVQKQRRTTDMFTLSCHVITMSLYQPTFFLLQNKYLPVK